MAEIIGARADAGRIEDHVRKTMRAALARGEDIAAAAQDRLAPAIAAVDAAIELQKTADETEATAWAQVEAQDAKSDAAIGGIRDAMWNALGRPRQSPHMDQVFPEGVALFTSGDPRTQPVMMQVLRSRILAASAPQWTQASRESWAAQIDALLGPYTTAVEAHRPAEASALVANAGFRAAIRSAHARLQAFKRDLLTLGLTNAQVHEIIPDASAGAGGGGGAKTTGGATPGNGAGATSTG
jgi:hypothetical protein